MPNTILHIDSSARQDGSVTRDLTARVATHLGGRVIRRDLADPLPLLDADWLAANWTAQDTRSQTHRDALALSDQLIEELRAADTVVIGVPLYNFGVPASLKAWIDLVARNGLTFSYGADGPKGLLDGKRAVLVVASGGVEIGSAMDFATAYMRQVLGFIGITDVEVVKVDRVVARGDEAVAEATAQIDALAA